MMPILSLSQGPRTLPTFSLLDQTAVILAPGGVIWGLWPFIESTGTVVTAYGGGAGAGSVLAGLALTSSDEAAARNLESEFRPYRHAGGIHSYYNVASTNNHLAGPDLASLSIGDGTTDQAWAFGIWFMTPTSGPANMSLISKYRTTAVAAREYDFRIGNTGELELELFDNSVPASEIATSTYGGFQNDRWYFAAACYDGNEASPTINLYVDGVLVNNGTSVETGEYVATEDTATPLLIGARDLTTSPAQEFEGRLALPCFTERFLTAAEVMTLYTIGQRLLGLTD